MLRVNLAAKSPKFICPPERRKEMLSAKQPAVFPNLRISFYICISFALPFLSIHLYFLPQILSEFRIDMVAHTIKLDFLLQKTITRVYDLLNCMETGSQQKGIHSNRKTVRQTDRQKVIICDCI